MRTIHVIIFTLVATALSGCVAAPDVEPDQGSDPSDGGDGGVPAGQVPGGNRSAAGLPEPIQEEGTMTASADPFNLVTQEICGPTASCAVYPFTLNRAAHVEAKLTWGMPFNDLDLYLREVGQIVERSGEAPPATTESFSAEITRGQYEVVVVGWLVTTETFHIDVQFS